MTTRIRVGLEAAAIALLFVVSVWYGRQAFLNPLTTPDYYYLAPAVTFAAGQGFVLPVPPSESPLDKFLSHREQSVPFDEVVGSPVAPIGQFDISARYLLTLLGYWWRWSGISWSAAGTVAGVFHALAVVGLYAALRIFVSMPLALAGGLWLSTSTLQLALVPHLRDFSKGAFVVAALPLLLVMVLRARRTSLLLLAALAQGVLLGLGFGFKRDVVVMVPLTVACLVLFRGSRPWREPGQKAMAGVVFVAAFLAVAWPVMSPLVGGGSHTMHVTLLGYAKDFDADLGVVPSVDDIEPFYNDGYVTMMVRAHERHYSAADFDVPSPAYDAAGQRLWLAIVRNLPADVVVRGLASIDHIMNLPFGNPPVASVVAVPVPGQALLDWLHRQAALGSGFGWILALGVVAVAGAVGIREGLLATALLFALAGYPSLQFMLRHYAYLQVLPVMAAALVAHAAFHVPRRATPSEGGIDRRRASGPSGAVVALATTLALAVVPLGLARGYQDRHMRRELTAWAEGPADVVRPDVDGDGAGDTRLSWPVAPGDMSSYRIDFEPDAADDPVHLAVRYRRSTFNGDFSRVLSVTARGKVASIGFTAVAEGDAQFAGLELGPRSLQRMRGIYRVLDGGPARLPIDVKLPGDWRSRSLFQRLAVERPEGWAVGPTVSCAGVPGCAGRLFEIERAGELPAASTGVGTIHAPFVRVSGGQVAAFGSVESDSAYLLQWEAQALPGQAAFLMSGTLDEGGVTIGLLLDQRWYKPITLRGTGPFVALIPIDAPGTYTPLVTAAMPLGERRIGLTLSHAGFLSH